MFPPIFLPLYAFTGALLDLLAPANSTTSFWGDFVGWAAVGWWVPVLLLPAAIALQLIAWRLPESWIPAIRRAALLVASLPLFIANFGAAAIALTRTAPLLKSSYVLVLIVPALAYAAVLRFPGDGDRRG